MTLLLRQSTASQEVLLGPFLDETDGITPLTALTIANTDIKVWKHGATTLANKNSGGATHISGGIYYATFDATDTDTIGNGEIRCHPSGALPIKVPFKVQHANLYDFEFGSAAPGTGTSTLDAAGVRTAVGLASANLDTQLAAIDDYLDTEVSAIKAKTDNLPSDPADQSAVEAAITAATSGLATAANLATVAGYLDTEIAAILADTNELQVDWTNGGRLDLLIDAVKAKTDSLTFSTANRVDCQVFGMEADTITASAIATGAIQVDALAADAISADKFASDFPAVIAAAVLNASRASYLTSGSIGEGISAAASAGDPWITNFAGYTTPGTFGHLVSSRLSAVASGTADSGSTTTLVDAERTESNDNHWVDARLRVTSGPMAGMERLVTGFVASTDTLTFSPALPSAISTQTYELIPSARTNVGRWVGEAPNALISGRLDVDPTNDAAELNAVADAIFDRVSVFGTGLTLRTLGKELYANIAGKTTITGPVAGITTVKFRDVADTKDVLTITIDANNQRASVTRDP